MKKRLITLFVISLLAGPIMQESSAFAADQSVVYMNRRTVADSDQAFESLLLKERPTGAPKLLLLDFSFRSAQLEARNMIDSKVSATLGNRRYATLAWNEKGSLIFEGFYRKLTSSDSIVHIDHHYRYPALSGTSTSVLLSDFLLWLYRAQETGSKPKDEVDSILNSLERGSGSSRPL